MKTDSIKLRLLHTGQYEVRFYISWDTPHSDVPEQTAMTPSNWEGNDTIRRPQYFEEICLPKHISNLHIRVDAKINMNLFPWRTIFEETFSHPHSQITMTLTGSYFHPIQELTLLYLPKVEPELPQHE